MSPKAAATTLVGDAIAGALARRGVTDVFGLIGSGNFRVATAISRLGIRFHSARHEEGALCMADAYARSARTVGVCSLHQGPGLTNCLTSLAEAVKARTPILLLAAAITDDRQANSWIEQSDVVESLGAASEWISAPAAAAADVARAFDRASSERRVVVVMIPLEVERADYAVEEELEEAARTPVKPSAPAPGAIAEAGRLLEKAEKPLILAGRGTVLADAGATLMELGERTGGLLATSAQAWGLFAEDQFDLGISGGFSTPLATRLIREADLILVFGASLNPWTTRGGKLLSPGAAIIQVDCDEDAFGRHQEVDIAVVGDVAEAANALMASSDGVVAGERGWRSPNLAEAIRHSRRRDQPYEEAGTNDLLDPRTLTKALDELIPRERVIVPDSGHFMGYPIMYMDVPDASGFVFTQAYMAIGLGLSSAIGASIAQPERAVVAALGDGGALMLLGELETLARSDRRVIVVIYNDAGYGAEVHRFRPLGFDVDLVRFPDTDFAAIGRALGIDSTTARSPEDLEPIREWAKDGGGPMLVDAKVNPDVRDAWMDEIPERRGRAQGVGTADSVPWR